MATEIVQIAETIVTNDVEKLQICSTFKELGRLALERFLPDLAITFWSQAVQIYVARRLWHQTADLYGVLGIAEAGTGDIGAAVGWLSLAAEVSESINEQENARIALSLAKQIQLHPAKFFTPAKQLKSILASGKASPPNAVVTEIYGLGVVAISAIVPSAVDALLQAERFGDVLLQFVRDDWPVAAIAAQAVDIRVIARIFRNPELLDNLEPRALEKLVSVLFEGFGAEVHLTKETRDGGYDVEAIFQVGDARFRVLIEAKKWKKVRKVGIEKVDRLIPTCKIIDSSLRGGHRVSPSASPMAGSADEAIQNPRQGLWIASLRSQ